MGKRTARERARDDIRKVFHLLNRATEELDLITRNTDKDGTIDSQALVRLYTLLRRALADARGPCGVVEVVLTNMTDEEFDTLLGEVREAHSF